MAYNGNWIDQLVPTDPAGSETRALGDDAIREIKRALTNTFPNAVAGDSYTGTFSQLNDLVAGATLPFNSIIMWSGIEANLPAGWTICDGRQRPGGGTAPDLRNRFILGAKSDQDGFFAPNVGNTGGNSEVNITGQTTNGHALTVAQLPSHGHALFSNTTGVSSPANTVQAFETVSVKTDNGQNENQRYNMVGSGSNPAILGVTSTSGQNGAHSHTFNVVTSGTGSNMPPWYALIFLIKD